MSDLRFSVASRRALIRGHPLRTHLHLPALREKPPVACGSAQSRRRGAHPPPTSRGFPPPPTDLGGTATPPAQSRRTCCDITPHRRPRPCSPAPGDGRPWGRTVSYTHLRAHETKANLVCRLLLEKKKNKK